MEQVIKVIAKRVQNTPELTRSLQDLQQSFLNISQQFEEVSSVLGEFFEFEYQMQASSNQFQRQVLHNLQQYFSSFSSCFGALKFCNYEQEIGNLNGAFNPSIQAQSRRQLLANLRQYQKQEQQFAADNCRLLQNATAVLGMQLLSTSANYSTKIKEFEQYSTDAELIANLEAEGAPRAVIREVFGINYQELSKGNKNDQIKSYAFENRVQFGQNAEKAPKPDKINFVIKSKSAREAELEAGNAELKAQIRELKDFVSELTEQVVRFQTFSAQAAISQLGNVSNQPAFAQAQEQEKLKNCITPRQEAETQTAVSRVLSRDKIQRAKELIAAQVRYFNYEKAVLRNQELSQLTPARVEAVLKQIRGGVLVNQVKNCAGAEKCVQTEQVEPSSSKPQAKTKIDELVDAPKRNVQFKKPQAEAAAEKRKLDIYGEPVAEEAQPKKKKPVY